MNYTLDLWRLRFGATRSNLQCRNVEDDSQFIMRLPTGGPTTRDQAFT